MGENSNPNRSEKYFFLNGVPHKKLQVNSAADILVAWNFIEKKVVSYIWSVARRDMKMALLNRHVEKILGRTRVSMLSYIKNGVVKTPYQVYSLDGQEAPGKYLWTEEEVLDLHEALMNNGPGRPRKDGRPVPVKLPSRAEVIAMMRNDVVLYTKTGDGSYKPVWQANDW